MPDTKESKTENAGKAVPDKEANMWSMFCHLSALVGFVIPFGNIIGPLVIWVLKKDEYPLVNENGKEALNFQISITIYIIASILLIFIVIGIPILIALAFFELFAIVIAAIKANEGVVFRYPLTIRFLD
jgi:uncharacterized Tic20 family protein